jgi:ribokinase
MKVMPNIVVIGSFVAGLTIRVPRTPVLGESLVGDSFDLGPGGKGTNQAIAAARLGAKINLLACLGDDIFADMAIALYRQEGIALNHIRQIPQINSGVGFVTLLPSGENSIVVDLGANMRLTPAHVDATEAIIAQSDIVMAQFEVPPEAIIRAMQLGHRHGAMTILNPAPARPVDPNILSDVDLLTPNDIEIRLLLNLPPDDPTPTLELAGRLLELGVKQIVVTQGSKGALIVTADGSQAAPPVPVQAVDVTGAGDSFNAALAVALAEGLALPAAVREASYAGAYTVTHLGVINGLPTRIELEAFKRSVGGAV